MSEERYLRTFFIYSQKEPNSSIYEETLCELYENDDYKGRYYLQINKISYLLSTKQLDVIQYTIRRIPTADEFAH